MKRPGGIHQVEDFRALAFVNAKFCKCSGDSIPFQPFDLEPPVKEADFVGIVTFKPDQFFADQPLLPHVFPFHGPVVSVKKNTPGIAHQQDENGQDEEGAYELK